MEGLSTRYPFSDLVEICDQIRAKGEVLERRMLMVGSPSKGGNIDNLMERSFLTYDQVKDLLRACNITLNQQVSFLIVIIFYWYFCRSLSLSWEQWIERRGDTSEMQRSSKWSEMKLGSKTLLEDRWRWYIK